MLYFDSRKFIHIHISAEAVFGFLLKLGLGLDSVDHILQTNTSNRT